MRPLPEEEQLVPMPQELWIPSYMEALKSFDLQIQFLDRGCVVSVGCKKIPFESVGEAMCEIGTYIDHPYETAQKWKKILNIK